MTANFYPGSTGPSESEIHSRLETAITRAVDAEGLSKQKEAHIKRQKYSYLLLKRFSNIADPPVTFSWFKWGACEWAGPSTTSPNRTLSADHPQANQLLDIELEQLVTHLRSGLDELTLQDWWEEDLLYFLEEFYTHYGHPEYKDLYLVNIQLLQLMDDIITTMQLDRNPVRPETVDETERLLQALNDEIRAIKHLEHHNQFVAPFSELFRGVITELETFEVDAIEQGHITAVDKLREFYRDHVWMIVASSISQFTAKGPNSSALNDASKQKEQNLIHGSQDDSQPQDSVGDPETIGFDEALRRNHRRCRAMNLVTQESTSPDLEELSERTDTHVDPSEAVADQRVASGKGMEKRHEEVVAAFEEINDNEQ